MIERVPRPPMPRSSMLLALGLAAVGCSTNGREAAIVTPSVPVVTAPTSVTAAPSALTGADAGNAGDAGTAQPGRATKGVTFSSDIESGTQVTGIASSDDGDVFVVGKLRGTLTAGAFQLKPEPLCSDRVFVLHFDPSGVVAWAVQLCELGSSNDASSVAAIALGPHGELAVSGSFGDPPRLSPMEVPTLAPGEVGPAHLPPKSGAFVTELGPDGTVRWTTPFIGAEDPGGLAFDPEGNLFLCDTFRFNLHVGRRSLRAWGYTEARYRALRDKLGRDIAGEEIPPGSFVAKLAPDGKPLWVHQLAGPDQVARFVALDAQGNVFVAGSFLDSTTFGTTKLTPGPRTVNAPERDAFVGAMDGSGRELWGQRFGKVNSEWEGVRAMALDAAGNILMAGMFRLGAGQRSSNAEQYLAKLDPRGAVMWSKQRSPGYGAGMSVASDRAGNVIASGSLGNPDVKDNRFVTKLDPNGAPLWESDLALRGPFAATLPLTVRKGVEPVIAAPITNALPVDLNGFPMPSVRGGFVEWLAP
jgi:hypothetical protein